MKILCDHNVPRGLRDALSAHATSTAKEMGWAELKNGDLLTAAEKGSFQLMITCDQNLIYQQNMAKRQIALIVLNTNDWKLIQTNLHLIEEAVQGSALGTFCFLKVRR